jgi:hypothetical protein
VAWGLFVWSVGEGYGGMFNGTAALIMGAPGAALIYALLALASLPSAKKERDKVEPEEKAARQPAAFWLVFVWSLLWFGGMFWQLATSGMNSVSGLKTMILANADGAPGWLSSIDIHTANFINSFGTYKYAMSSGQSMNMMQMAQMPIKHGTGDWFTPLLAIVMLLIGMGVYWKPIRKVTLILGIIVSLIFWVVGQSLGTYYTGLATDPNSGPLIVLLAIAIFGCWDLDAGLKRFMDRSEDLLVGKDNNVVCESSSRGTP